MTQRDKIIALVGAICGGSPLENGEEETNRRRLILGEEEPLPDIPEPERAPYVSPTLEQVKPLERALTYPPNTSDDSSILLQHPATSEFKDLEHTSVDVSERTGTDVAKQPAREHVLDEDDVMVQVARLEEQGRLVEASKLMARALRSTTDAEVDVEHNFTTAPRTR